MGNYIAIALIILVLFLAIKKIIKEKKKGVTCIGCPDGGCKNCNCHCTDDMMEEMKAEIKKNNKQ